MSSAPTLNGLRITRLRIIIPWRGVWLAECHLDPDTVSLVPTSGAVSLALNDTTTLTGVVDPRGSGSWVAAATVLVIGGQGGWDNITNAQQFYSATGVITTTVYQAIAGAVSEPPPVDPSPQAVGSNFPVIQGAASRVFLDRDWYVDPISGVTQVAAWPTASLASTATITNFEASELRVDITSPDVPLILPGTVFSDSRFNGTTYTARDVEIVITKDGSKASAWCSTQPVSRLQSAFTAAVREFAQTGYLNVYRYRFVQAANANYSELALQAITPGAPDLNPISQWAGLSGLQAKIAQSTEIIVGFTGDAPPVPYIVAVSNLTTPIEVDIAGGAGFLTPALFSSGLLTALTNFCIAAKVASPSLEPTLIAAATALQVALSQLPAPATLITKAT
jgi:hypothetical protein